MLVGSLPFQDPAHPNSYPKMVEVRCYTASQTVVFGDFRCGCGLLAWTSIRTAAEKQYPANRGLSACRKPGEASLAQQRPPVALPPTASQRIGRVQYHLPSQLQLSPGCVDMIQRIFVHVSQCSSSCCAADAQRRGSLVKQAPMCARRLA